MKKLIIISLFTAAFVLVLSGCTVRTSSYGHHRDVVVYNHHGSYGNYVQRRHLRHNVVNVRGATVTNQLYGPNAPRRIARHRRPHVADHVRRIDRFRQGQGPRIERIDRHPRIERQDRRRIQPKKHRIIKKRK